MNIIFIKNACSEVENNENFILLKKKIQFLMQKSK